MNGDPCVLSVNEVRQLMASGTIDAVDQVDDINFATQPETACHPLPAPGCTDKNRLFADATANRPVVSPLATTEELSGAQGLRRVLRLRAREHGEGDRRRRRRHDPAGGRDHLAGVVRARRSRRSRPSRCAARCTRAAAPTRAASRWRPGSEPNNGSTTDIPAGRLQAGLLELVRRLAPTRARSAARSRPST